MKARITIENVCEGACFCDGRCKIALSNPEKISALEKELHRLRNSATPKLDGIFVDSDRSAALAVLRRAKKLEW